MAGSDESPGAEKTGVPSDGKAAAAARITAPIPLLAFLGVLVEGIVGAIALLAIDKRADIAVKAAAVAVALALPVLLIVLVYLLMVRYPGHLYGPREYHTVEDFMVVLASGRSEVEDVGKGVQSRPFAPTAVASTQPISELEKHAAKWEPILDAMTPEEFSALHAWHNEQERYPLALLCLAIAIAKGAVSFRNFSFIAANLRKLGRLAEVEASVPRAGPRPLRREGSTHVCRFQRFPRTSWNCASKPNAPVGAFDARPIRSRWRGRRVRPDERVRLGSRRSPCERCCGDASRRSSG